MGVVLGLADLAGYVALLLWGTHMVTSGVQRGYGATLRQQLGLLLRSGRSAFGAGLAVTLALQSSTATGLMGASFVAEGLIALDTGFLMMLGANVGTALVARALSFPIAVFAPVAILAGFVLFRRARTDRTRNLGRMAMGLGLMLLALHLLVNTLDGWLGGPVVGGALQAMGEQPVLVGLVALGLTWMCHSSVAVILLGSALLGTHAWPVETILAILMGANLGGAIPPALEAHGVEARRLPVGNLLVRALGVVLLLLLVPLAHRLPAPWVQSPQFLVNAHLVFNLALALLVFPLGRPFGTLLHRLLPSPALPTDPGQPRYLTDGALTAPNLAIAAAEREALRLADKAEEVFQQALGILRAADEGQAKVLRQDERAIARLGLAVRRYVARLPDELPSEERRRRQEVLRFIYDMEQLADLVANGLIKSAIDRRKDRAAFSEAEWATIMATHAEIVAGFHLAVAVFLSQDQDAARRLIEQKINMRVLENDAVRGRIDAVREGDPVAIRPGDALITVLRDLTRVHSHLTGVAYELLDRTGQLRSRLVDVHENLDGVVLIEDLEEGLPPLQPPLG